MKCLNKICLLVLLAVIAVVVGVGLVMSRSRQQIVTLADGRQLRFAGATWGTNQSQPRLIARFVDRLPASLANYLRKKLEPRLGDLAPFRFREPMLCVWFRPVGTSPPSGNGMLTNVFAVLTDQNGITGGGSNRISVFAAGGTDLLYVGAYLLPRRSHTLQCMLLQTGSSPRELGRVTFFNPAFGRFPQWQPEPMTIVKQAGSAEARLTNPAINADATPCATFDLALKPPPGSNERWAVTGAELSDATGNLTRRWHMSGESASPKLVFEALWPDEAAWRLKIELMRTAGQDPGEFVTFKNVPVPKARPGGPDFVENSSTLFPLTNYVSGTRIVLANFARNVVTSFDRAHVFDAAIRAELPAEASNMVAVFAGAVTDTGERVTNWHAGRNSFVYGAFFDSLPSNAATMDFTFAVEKTRSVVFLAKPPPRIESANHP
jgi:hypothetical protein